MIRVNIDVFRYIEGAFPNVILVSGSDDDCYVHYYIQQQNTSESFLSTSASGGETTDGRV